MTEALAHRGPDGEGRFIDDEEAVFLGHRRLAILDIAGGNQPMWNEDGKVGVIFNGEIYNHVELRRELERKGHTFRSNHSDTEVLVHGYEEWGETLPERLNAMFAFAIYDAPRRRLFLARDRFGEKPLYYAQLPGLFAFASELSALCQHRGIARNVDLQSVQKLFAYGYIPAPRALLENTRKLPAGHHITVDISSGQIRTAAYWRFRLNPDGGLSEKDEPRLIEELTHLLSEAVRRRTISDVPLGVFLSGGINSGAVLSQLARHVPAPSIKSFTIGFTEPSFDEAPQARELAAAFRTDHKEQQLDLDRARDLIAKVLGRLDEPLGDASILPTYLLSSFTRRFVTVALTGDGGDELFAGARPVQGAYASPSLHTAGALRNASGPQALGRLSADLDAKHELRVQAQARARRHVAPSRPLESGLDGASQFDRHRRPATNKGAPGGALRGSNRALGVERGLERC